MTTRSPTCFCRMSTAAPTAVVCGVQWTTSGVQRSFSDMGISPFMCARSGGKGHLAERYIPATDQLHSIDPNLREGPDQTSAIVKRRVHSNLPRGSSNPDRDDP